MNVAALSQPQPRPDGKLFGSPLFVLLLAEREKSDCSLPPGRAHLDGINHMKISQFPLEVCHLRLLYVTCLHCFRAICCCVPSLPLAVPTGDSVTKATLIPFRGSFIAPPPL
jgi:hypothetical protein